MAEARAPSASNFRTWLILGMSALGVTVAVWSARSAMHSPMFLIQVIEIADLPQGSPVDEQELTQLAGVAVGKVNLFDLDLKAVESRVLSHPWIREVRLEKHFPQTLSISVSFREPLALVQSENGVLSYVDAAGKVFGRVDLMMHPDLPVIAAGGTQISQALQLIHGWDESKLSKFAQLSQLQWDAERGFRALVSYPLESRASGARGRTFVDLGQSLDADGSRAQFERLSKVFKYLSANRVVARQVWADAGKKIVVKTARGS